MMKNAFYFTLRALFVLKIFTFFGHVAKRLDKKAIGLIRYQPGNKYVQYAMPHILRSKSNQTMKFVNETLNAEELVQDPFQKSQN